MPFKLTKINKNSVYYKGILSLGLGTILSQILGFVGLYIATRYYNSEHFGVFSKLMSTASVLTIFFTLRLESGVILSKTKKEANAVANTTLKVILLSTLVAIITCLLIPSSFLMEFSTNKLLLYITIIIATNKAMENTLNAALTFSKDFTTQKNSRIIFTITKYLLQIPLFFIIPETGLIVGFLLASFIVTNYLFVKSEFAFNLKSNIREYIKKYKNLVTYGTLSDSLNALNINIIPVIAAFYFTDDYIGWYFLALTILSIPLFLVNSTFSKVFFLKTSEVNNTSSKEIFKTVKSSVQYLVLILLFPFLITTLFGVDIIEFILGNSWKNTGIYLTILAPLFFIRCIYNPLSNLEEVLRKNHIGLLFNIYLLIVNILSFYVGGKENNFENVLIYITISNSIGYVLMITYFILKTKKLSPKES